MSVFYNSRAKPEYLARWADWMLSSRWVGIMTFYEYTWLQQVLRRL